jgi:APA family basic amino acid/polyamine antiporter
MTSVSPAPTRLARQLTTVDAVMIGMGSMIGAGVFAAFTPAAEAAGNGLLYGLALAAVIAYCNATSSAQLAALYPESGGTYIYGRNQLSHFWGFLAGWGFLVGKVASCAAMAMIFASYAAPDFMQPVAVSAVVVLTLVNYFGVKKTALLTKIIVTLVLLALMVVVSAIWGGGATDVQRLWPITSPSVSGIFQAAGFLFFAFAGYARMATMGEEVIEPARTIPRAITVALAITLVIYTVIAISLIAGIGAPAVATSSAPLAAAVEAGNFAWSSPAVRIGASIASLGVLLSLIIGVSRTTFAMASQRDLPGFFAVVHPRFHIPHRAELMVGSIVIAIVAVGDIR